MIMGLSGETTLQSPSISVAFAGNSILYFNDCPRLLEQILVKSRIFDDETSCVYQNSCLRGGASLSSLWEEGNGMTTSFATPPARLLADGTYDVGSPMVSTLLEERAWDYVVLQDYTQGPARENSREETIASLKRDYLPALAKLSDATVILLETFAYKRPAMRGSEDLGDFDKFTQLLQHGYEQYRKVLSKALSGTTVLIAPMGTAVHYLYHHDKELWEKLYSRDDFHPSPLGTYLQACVLYFTMLQQQQQKNAHGTLGTEESYPTPEYDPDWWKQCRYMQPPKEEALARPTRKEAIRLAEVARMVCCREVSLS